MCALSKNIEYNEEFVKTGPAKRSASLHFRPQRRIIQTMSRKTISAILAVTYALTIPVLLVVHVHPLGIGSGTQVFSVATSGFGLSRSQVTDSASCQLCPRLASLDLPQAGSSPVSPQQFLQSFSPFEISTISLLLFRSVDLRAPPAAFLA